VITQEEITKLVELVGGAGVVARKLGVRENTIYRLVRGQNKPSYDTQAKLVELQNEFQDELTDA
jgi:plasmid maintenance system antidote protein VapI